MKIVKTYLGTAEIFILFRHYNWLCRICANFGEFCNKKFLG